MIYLIYMVEIETEVRKWGDSLAIIIPKQLANMEKIHLRDQVHVVIEKEMDLSDLFGIIKGKTKKSPQQLKDESRRGWN